VPTFLSRLKEIAANTKNPDEAAFVDAFMRAWEDSKDRDIGMPAEPAPPSEIEIGGLEPVSADEPDPEE
jgi:hypothetical protein